MKSVRTLNAKVSSDCYSTFGQSFQPLGVMESIAEEGPAASFRQSPFLPSIKEDVNHRLDSFNVAEAADTLTELKFKPRLACRWSQYFGQETLKSYLSDTVARSNDGKLNKSSKIIRKEMPLFVESAGHDVLVMESMEKARLARKASEKIRQADKHRMATKPKRAPTTKAMLEQCEKISAMHVSEETEIALPKMANAEQEKCASVDVKESDKPVQCTKSQASKNFPSIGTDSMKWLFERKATSKVKQPKEPRGMLQQVRKKIEESKAAVRTVRMQRCEWYPAFNAKSLSYKPTGGDPVFRFTSIIQEIAFGGHDITADVILDIVKVVLPLSDHRSIKLQDFIEWTVQDLLHSDSSPYHKWLWEEHRIQFGVQPFDPSEPTLEVEEQVPVMQVFQRRIRRTLRKVSAPVFQPAKSTASPRPPTRVTIA